MKTYFKNIFYSVLIGTSILSCTEDITLPLDKTYARLVVDAIFTTDTTAHRVLLSRSGDALNKEAIVPITGANVIIISESDTFNLEPSPITNGLYLTKPNVYGIPGKIYNLQISQVDIDDDGIFETYTAQSELRKIAPIDSIELMFQQFGPERKGYMLNLYGWDIGGRNYYLTKALINDTLITDSIKEYGYTNNAGFDGKYYPGLGVYYLNDNKPDEKLQIGDKVTLELNSITEEYFNFVDGFQQELRPKVPIFSGPSANVITNINPKDKAVGFFTAYSIYRASTIFWGDSTLIPPVNPF